MPDLENHKNKLRARRVSKAAGITKKIGPLLPSSPSIPFQSASEILDPCWFISTPSPFPEPGITVTQGEAGDTFLQRNSTFSLAG